jgi:hypothetical protein
MLFSSEKVYQKSFEFNLWSGKVLKKRQKLKEYEEKCHQKDEKLNDNLIFLHFS